MSQELSAYERAAASGADPRCRPVHLDRPMPEGDAIRYPCYSAVDCDTWATLYGRQTALLEDRACVEFLAGLERMAFGPREIPGLAAASRMLDRVTGWRVARAPGLLHERDFFACLARRVFPSTDYVRPAAELDYTPAPDMFHDVFGHMPMITHAVFADFYQRLGQVARRAQGVHRRQIERFYWFTVEFGLIQTAAGLRIYGNGILSSYGEVRHCLTDAVEKRPFDVDRIVETEYDVWHMQPQLFVVESFEQLAEEFERWARRAGLVEPSLY